MSDLQYFIDRLNETTAAVAQLSQVVNEHPDDDILRINAESVMRRQSDLARKIDRHLAVTQNEFVSYRIVRDWGESYPVRAVAASIMSFQELFTSIFDSINVGPKRRYRPSQDSLELSTLEFAGSAAGSVIVAMSIPNDRLLVGETAMDRAFSLLEKTLSAQTADDLKLLAQDVGVASITKAYTWAEVASAYGLKTEISWGKAVDVKNSVVISSKEAAAIKELIEMKSDEDSKEYEFPCTLLGFDGDTSYFHIVTLNDGHYIKGDVAPGVPGQWTTNLQYLAKVRLKTQIKYATGEEKVLWTLLSLVPLQMLST